MITICWQKSAIRVIFYDPEEAFVCLQSSLVFKGFQKSIIMQLKGKGFTSMLKYFSPALGYKETIIGIKISLTMPGYQFSELAKRWNTSWFEGHASLMWMTIKLMQIINLDFIRLTYQPIALSCIIQRSICFWRFYTQFDILISLII